MVAVLLLLANGAECAVNARFRKLLECISWVGEMGEAAAFIPTDERNGVEVVAEEDVVTVCLFKKILGEGLFYLFQLRVLLIE